MVTLRLISALCFGAGFALPTFAYAQEGGQTVPPPPPPSFGAGARVAAAPRLEPKKLPLFYLDLKDAPTRQALELVLHAAKTDFSVDNNVGGHLNLRTGGGTVEDFLTLAAKRHPEGLKWGREGELFLVKPAVSKKKETTAEPAAAVRYGNVVDVPRRAAGIARGEQWVALLVTGEGTAADDNAKIVRVGDRVPSGVPGIADLKVQKISAREVVLTLPDGTLANGETTLTVPVKRLPSAKE